MTEHLNQHQAARAEAIDRARAALAARSPIAASSVDPQQLVQVADWIVHGSTTSHSKADPAMFGDIPDDLADKYIHGGHTS